MLKILYKNNAISNNADDIVNVNINKEEFQKRYSYVYTEDTTIFTKEGLKKFYLTTAIKFAILFTLIDNEELLIEKSGISISDSIIDRASLASIMLIQIEIKYYLDLQKNINLRSLLRNISKSIVLHSFIIETSRENFLPIQNQL